MPEPVSIPWRPLVITIAIASAIALVLHAVSIATRERPELDGVIDLPQSAERAPSGAEPKPQPRAPLRFAIAPVVSPETSLRSYQPLVDLVGQRCGMPAQFLTRGSYAEVAEMLRQRQCDVALVCTYVYVRGQRDYGLQAIAAPVVHGASSYHSVIIVPQPATATSLLDLGGARLASSDLLSTSGWIWPAQWLRDHGRDPARHLVQVLTGSHDRSVQAVLRGQADAAAVDSIVYADMAAADPAVGQRTRVIQRSPPFGMPPVVCHPGLDADLRTRIQEALFGLHRDAQGAAVLATIGFDRFVPAEDSAYEGVRATASAWDAGP